LKIDKKTLILKAAAKRFARHGVNKTTLYEIARDLRIGKATLYHYFNSKLDIYHEVLEWEKSLYIKDIKAILDNNETSLVERFIEYFNFKEALDEKYKLLYDTILLLLIENNQEFEMKFLKSIMEGEEKTIKLILTKIYNKGKTVMEPALPMFLVLQSWGLLFEKKLYSISLSETSNKLNTNEMLYKTLEKILG